MSDIDATNEKPKDTMREMCVAQGYVPPKCQLMGMVVWHLIQKGEDPCAGCNLDRNICGGRPRK